MENEISIQENFLPEERFDALRDVITALEFPWFFTPTTVDPLIDKESTTGLFAHTIYHKSVPTSELFQSFYPILDQMDVSILMRIKMNLQPRLPKPDYATFHIDTDGYEKDIQLEWTTSILYMNTNNGYTEFKNSDDMRIERIGSVANRLVSFPSHLEHRGVSQTDAQTRILINFNYLKEIR